MTVELTEELLSSVLQHISDNPKCSAGQIPGDPESVLLALRHLRWKGLIKGGFECDMRKIGNDQGGGYLADAIMLETT